MKSQLVMKCAGLILLSICLCACSYSAGRDGGAGISVSISPLDGSTDQPVDVDVTAEFNDTIEEPENWEDVFLLKKESSGENLCYDITYSTESQVAICHHDDLDFDTSYTVTVSGVLQVNGKITLFRTEQ